MSLSDPIADMLTRVRNAQKAGLPDVSIPSSKMKAEIARVMKEKGFIASYTFTADNRDMIVTLKYDGEGEAVIRGLRRDSRPGLRRYCSADEIPAVLGGMGIVILSTSAGIMTGRDARKRGIGGEVICSIW